MGKYNYDSLKSAQVAGTTNTSKRDFPRVGHFWLSDNKPSAIVRFDVSSPNDLEIVDVHNVTLTRDDKKVYRYVACLRNNDEPFKNCPLCAQNIKTRNTQVFVKMIEYYIDKEGQVVAAPAVWSRGSNFADELVTLLNQYGDLKDHLFKVTRERVNNKTKYSVLYQPEMGIYTESAGYTKDFSALDNLLINKHSYMERTFEELETFVKTGEMASRKPTVEKQESKNLETLISDEVEEKEIEHSLDMLGEDAPSVVEPPVPTDDELPFSNSTTTQHAGTTVNRQGIEDNPTSVRRRRYDFNDDASGSNSFTNPF